MISTTKQISLLFASTLVGVFIPTAQAIDLGNGRRAFESSPVLVRSAASRPTANSASTYHFTIKVPDDAQEALKAVTVRQKGSPERIKFDVSQSSAFLGDSFAGGKDLALADIGSSQPNDRSEVTVVFDEPVEPGNTVTISLKTNRNPNSAGVYLLGVTAFPEGENSPGLYLGSGRFSFVRN